MKAKIKTGLVACLVMVGMLFSMYGRTAFAYTGGEEQQTTGTGNIEAGSGVSDTGTEAGNAAEAPTTEEPSDTENEPDEGGTTGRVQGTPFSVPGNGQLVDDLSEDGSKQFLTIQTKNGNTFFMVLDRSNRTENVYMLSMIDENDLEEFIEDTKKEAKQEQSVVLPEIEDSSVSAQAEKDLEPEEEKGGMSKGALFAIVLLVVGGISGFYYFKVWKPKQDEEESDGEDLEFYDGGAYINEDQEDSDDDEEE